ncbi:MAG: type II toxin-antitoxin system RelB/DinJ family antitoxin [Patescibacteria group bacterium]
MPSTRLQYRIDPGLKREAEGILEEQGITPAVAISVFYTEITRSGGFPFLPSKVPNKKLQKALNEAKTGKGVKTYDSKRALFDDLDGV